MLVGYLLGGVQVPGHSGESDSVHFYERGLIKKKLRNSVSISSGSAEI